MHIILGPSIINDEVVAVLLHEYTCFDCQIPKLRWIIEILVYAIFDIGIIIQISPGEYQLCIDYICM